MYTNVYPRTKYCLSLGLYPQKLRFKEIVRFWFARHESKGRRNDGPRTVSMQSENGGVLVLGIPAKHYISRSLGNYRYTNRTTYKWFVFILVHTDWAIIRSFLKNIMSTLIPMRFSTSVNGLLSNLIKESFYDLQLKPCVNFYFRELNSLGILYSFF